MKYVEGDDYTTGEIRYAYYLSGQYKDNNKHLISHICWTKLHELKYKRYNKKRIYIENLGFYEYLNPTYKSTYCKKEYTAFNDILVKYYLNNYQKVWFNTEEDYILWRLKYNI